MGSGTVVPEPYPKDLNTKVGSWYTGIRKKPRDSIAVARMTSYLSLPCLFSLEYLSYLHDTSLILLASKSSY